jgi:hypothetical protein
MKIQHITFSNRNTLVPLATLRVAQPLLAVQARLRPLFARDLAGHSIQEMVSRSFVPANMLPGGEPR